MRSIRPLAAQVVLSALAASGGGVASAAVPSDPVDVVAALAEQPPRVLSQLEAVIGDLHRDPSVWEDAVGPIVRVAPSRAVAHAEVHLAIDVFHQDPEKELDPLLESWTLKLRSGREQARNVLIASAPEQLLHDGARTVWRYGELYFSELGDEDGFRLDGYWREPLFAIPQRSDAETAALADALVAIARAGFTHAAIAAHLGPLAYDPALGRDALVGPTWKLELAPAGTDPPERVQVSFDRPLPAARLLAGLGIERPILDSSDVHMQSRSVVDLAHPRSEVTGYALPAAGPYVLSIYVDPEGLATSDEELPWGGPTWSAEGAQVVAIYAFLPPTGER